MKKVWTVAMYVDRNPFDVGKSHIFVKACM